MSSNWPIYGAKSPVTAEPARVVDVRPKENPEAGDLRGLGVAGKLPTVRLQLPKRGSPDELTRL